MALCECSEMISKIHEIPITVKSLRFMMKLQYRMSYLNKSWLFSETSNINLHCFRGHEFLFLRCSLGVARLTLHTMDLPFDTVAVRSRYKEQYHADDDLQSGR